MCKQRSKCECCPKVQYVLPQRQGRTRGMQVRRLSGRTRLHSHGCRAGHSFWADRLVVMRVEPMAA